MRVLLSLLLTFSFASITCYSQEGLEILSERSSHSKMFIKGDGSKEELISNKPLHYYKNGEWLSINNNLISTPTRYLNNTNTLRSSFPHVLNPESRVDIELDGSKISFESLKRLVTYSNIDGVEIMDVPSNNSLGVVSGNQLTYENVYTGYTDKYSILAGEIKNEFIINTNTLEIANLNSGYFGFQERIVLPTNWSLEPIVVQNTYLIESGIKILDDQNNHILTIPAPVFFDNGGIADDGSSMIQGAYLIDKDKEGWLLSTVVPVSWLNDPNTSYPLVIDPTVVFGGATGGWQSQNNFVDNPGFVFIGVCCGNLEHRAWLQFNTTSIDDAACVTDVELEVFVNGVGGAASELVHAYDMTGAFGPYGAIVPAVYTDMGDGYYTSFTLAGAGTYGYYNLGSSASALLETQLTTMNAFQVALIFDNEPSTNWKRLTAGNCNLRVTYDNPPCSPLPVGLVNFEAKCDNNNALLKWTTITESNSDYFTILKSSDGVEFTEIGQVKANGNSTSVLNYRWVDPAGENEIAYYKLSQTDIDGSFQEFDAKFYSGCADSEPVVFMDEMNNIRIRGNNITNVEFRDNIGRVVATTSHVDGQDELIMSNTNFITGLYSVSVIYDFGRQKSMKFLFTK